MKGIPKYATRLWLILLGAIVVALGVRALLVPEGFGKYGHYRAEAPDEEASLAPVHQGKQKCAKCHKKEFEAHEKDVHVSVQCEDCHGNGFEHVKAREQGAPKEKGKMFISLRQANCLACHRRLMARPGLFPTVDVKEHFKLVGVKDPDTDCQSCHNPHEPLFLEKKVEEARLHPVVHRCTDCHKSRLYERKQLPEGHLKVFRCDDCHAAIMADFKTKSHAQLDCRTCHLFRKETEFSGRIFANANPRFCLLCHLKRPFKDEKRIPLLESYKQHLEDVGGDEDNKCVDCHQSDNIHGTRADGIRIVATWAEVKAEATAQDKQTMTKNEGSKENE